MKRDFLEGLGLEKEVVDKILAANGADIEREKGKIDTVKNDLADAHNELTKWKNEYNTLKSQQAEAGDFKTKFDELQSKYDTDIAQYQKQIADREYADVITREIADRKLKFSSKSAEKAFADLLKQKNLAIKDGKFEGMDDFVKAQRESDPDAFLSETPIVKFSSKSGFGGAPEAGKSRAAKIAEEYRRNLYGTSKEEK